MGDDPKPAQAGLNNGVDGLSHWAQLRLSALGSSCDPLRLRLHNLMQLDQ